jgi:hypothetical protein
LKHSVSAQRHSAAKNANAAIAECRWTGVWRDYAARDVHAEETFVTEAEWLAATDPRPMLRFLRGDISARKLRRFVSGCYGLRFPDLVALPDRPDPDDVQAAREKAACEAAATRSEYVFVADTLFVQPLSAAEKAAFRQRRYEDDLAMAIAVAAEDKEHGPQQVALLHELVRSPFRRIADPARRSLARADDADDAVRQLAEAIYETQEFDRLPLLADALEDAGCTDAELVGHLRGPGPHVRGCWAADLILSKDRQANRHEQQLALLASVTGFSLWR